MEKDDLAILLRDAPAEEVDRIHRLAHEWSVGPDSSFPVQLTLLTKAQWRIAANLPRLMNDSRKLIELHLAEYRRQSQTMADDFANTMDGQNKELKTAVEIHVQATRQAADRLQMQLADAEAVAKRIKSLMENAVSGVERNQGQHDGSMRAIATGPRMTCKIVSAWRVILRTAWSGFCWHFWH